MSRAHERVMSILGHENRVMNSVFRSTHSKVAAVLDLKDNPIVGVAGQFSQQQPSAALPQLSESLTQLALQKVQEEMGKSTAVNDPMEAENERLRRQLENLRLQNQLAEETAKQQQAQQPQQPAAPQGGGGMPPAPAGGMPGGEQQMPPDMAAMYGAGPGPEQGGGGGEMGGEDMGGDPMEAIRQALGGQGV